MNPGEIEAAIRSKVEVTPALVLQAKAHLVTHASGDTPQMVNAFVNDLGAALISPVVIHAAADHEAVVADVARYLSCQQAAREAIWALIGAGTLVPRTGAMDGPDLGIAWTTVIPGSGGESSGWRFGQAIPVPASVSLASSGPTHLTDGDLFLATLALSDLDATIVESLRSAITCFRHDLYLPAQVMLGRAAEGAWTLLGEALVAAAPTESAAIALGRDLAKGIHFGRLPAQVTTLYTHAAYAAVVAGSAVSHRDLRNATVWTDALREARNAVHHGVEAPVPATWEATAALLMGTVPNIRSLWAVTLTARAAAPS